MTTISEILSYYYPLTFNLFKADFKTFKIEDFPENGSPIIITPCLTKRVLYNCMVFSLKYSVFYKFNFLIESSIAWYKLSYSLDSNFY